MFTNKYFRFIIVICAIIQNFSNAQDNKITFEILQNGDYTIHRDNHIYAFITTTGLSNGLSNLNDDYFRITSVTLDNKKINTLIFKDVQNTEPCEFLIRNEANFKPNIIFDCENNNINFTKITGINLNSFKIISKQFIVRNCIATNQNNNQQITYDDAKYSICGAFCITYPYSSFELKCYSK